MKVSAPFPEGYELIDAGNGRKLERWGHIVTIRPEHQAYFPAVLSNEEWKTRAHWEFIPVSEGAINGTWKQLDNSAPDKWLAEINGLYFNLEITSNKHIGLFPEQVLNWNFISEFLSPEKRFLNAFAYTGAASVFGAATGAEVLHCDSVKGMLDWGRLNMESNGLDGIKWVLEDALKFISREKKRGNLYDLVQMDPPAWGLGAKKEKWKLEDKLPELMHEALGILKPGGVLILNTYSPKMNRERIASLCDDFGSDFEAENHELWMKSTSGKKLYFGILTRIKKLP